MVECTLSGMFIFDRHDRFCWGGDILHPRISVVRIFSFWYWDLVGHTFLVEDSSFYRVIIYHDSLGGRSRLSSIWHGNSTRSKDLIDSELYLVWELHLSWDSTRFEALFSLEVLLDSELYSTWIKYVLRISIAGTGGALASIIWTYHLSLTI